MGLLPPLARLLKVDMNALFEFHETLSRQEIGLFCNQLAGKALEEAFALAQEKLREFPHDESLRLNVALLLNGLLMQSTTDHPELEAQVSAWYTQLGQSEDEAIRASANSMQVNRYIRQNRLDEAQEVLDTIPDKGALSAALPDKLMLQVSLDLKRGQPEEAALALEQALFQAGTRTQLLLSRLVDAELACGDADAARSVVETSQAIAQALELWPYNQYTALWQVAVHNRDAQEALTRLEQMLEALEQPWQLGDTVLYRRSCGPCCWVSWSRTRTSVGCGNTPGPRPFSNAPTHEKPPGSSILEPPGVVCFRSGISAVPPGANPADTG